ncbi:MAG: discoidin domain-containing protein [Microthrixaceae bacterium]
MRPLRGRWRIALAVCSALLALGVPAAANVEIANYVDSELTTHDGAPLYAYASGGTASWSTKADFARGASSHVAPIEAQSYASVEIEGNRPYVRSHGEGTNGNTTTEWSPRHLLNGMTTADHGSIDATPGGLVAVAVVTTTSQIHVARQVQPGVWPQTVAWTRVPSNGTPHDIEVAFMPNGLLALLYLDTFDAVRYVEETAPGVWGSQVPLGRVSHHVSLTVKSNGDLLGVALDSNERAMWIRQRIGPKWQPWERVCTPTAVSSDVSAVAVGDRVAIYASTGTTIVSCLSPPPGGTTWRLSTIYTANAGNVGPLGTAARFDGGVMLMGERNGIEASGIQPALGATMPSMTDIDGTQFDLEAASYSGSVGLSTRRTGTGFATSGTWTSETRDTHVSGIFGVLRASTYEPTGTDVRFQVAATNSGTPTAYVGPDGTAATYFTSDGGALPYFIDGKRYVRVRATLTGTTSVGPRLYAVSIGYALQRLKRNAEGSYIVPAPADLTSWVVRMSTIQQDLAGTIGKLTDSGSSWDPATAFTAHLDDPAPQCCGATQFTVAGGTSTPSGAPGTPVVTSGSRIGQSFVLRRSNLLGGSGNVVKANALSGSLQTQRPLAVGLSPDIAIGKAAAQKTNDYPDKGLAGAAVDGNTDGNFYDLSVTHTDVPSNDPTGAQEAWLKVDLGRSEEISEIRLWNRTDCCSDRLRDYTILASEEPIDLTNLNSALTSVQAHGGYIRSVAGTTGLTDRSLLPRGTTARHVAVILRAKATILSLAELEVIPD